MLTFHRKQITQSNIHTQHLDILHKHRLSTRIVLDREATGTIRSKHLLLTPVTGTVHPEWP